MTEKLRLPSRNPQIARETLPRDITVLISAPANSQFAIDGFFKNLVCENLASQGFQDIRSFDEFDKKVSDSDSISLEASQKSDKLNSAIMIIGDPDFVSPNYECLQLQSPSPITIGLKVVMGRKAAQFDAKCEPIDPCDQGSWADGYSDAGVMLMTRDSFLKLFGSTDWPSPNNCGLQEWRKNGAIGAPIPGKSVLQSHKGFHDSKLSPEGVFSWLKQVRKPCLFLDRDGILNEDTGYPHKKKDFQGRAEILPILKLARNSGYQLIVLTNQAGLAKGKFHFEDYEAFNSGIIEWLSDHGLAIDAWYHCPYHIDGAISSLSLNSVFRKPNPAMVFSACSDYAIDLKESFMIGDKDSDQIDLDILQCFLIQGRYTLASPNPNKFTSAHELFVFLTTGQTNRKTLL